MYEIRQYCDNAEEEIRREFVRKSVIANWGNRKAYIVHDVIFNRNPCTQTFSVDSGKHLTVAEYFAISYSM
jgi:hypothetical protein